MNDGVTKLPPLPVWEQPPADEATAIRAIKKALRARMSASGRSVDQVFDVIAALVADRVAEIRAANADQGTAWPSVDYAEVAAGTVSSDVRDLVRRRGCLIVRGHFDREQALEWDRSLIDYLDSNRFDDVY